MAFFLRLKCSRPSFMANGYVCTCFHRNRGVYVCVCDADAMCEIHM